MHCLFARWLANGSASSSRTAKRQKQTWRWICHLSRNSKEVKKKKGVVRVICSVLCVACAYVRVRVNMSEKCACGFTRVTRVCLLLGIIIIITIIRGVCVSHHPGTPTWIDMLMVIPYPPSPPLASYSPPSIPHRISQSVSQSASQPGVQADSQAHCQDKTRQDIRIPFLTHGWHIIFMALWVLHGPVTG